MSVQYQTLAQIPQLGTTVDPTSLSSYLQKVFEIGIGVAAGLAVIMIVLGGIEYMSTDAIGGKEEGKEKITSALWGLLLALSAWLILNTINPALLNMNLQVNPAQTAGAQAQNQTASIQPVNSGVAGGSWGANGATGNFGDVSSDSLAGNQTTGNGWAIAQSAESSVGYLSTANADTANGDLGCAYGVNQVVQNALGQPIDNSLSTTQMYSDLSGSSNFTQVQGGLGQAAPGDIVISPTQGGTTGHVGIVGSDGGIISNSSSQGGVMQENFSASSWNNTYSSQKGLPVYVFRAK